MSPEGVLNLLALRLVVLCSTAGLASIITLRPVCVARTGDPLQFVFV